MVRYDLAFILCCCQACLGPKHDPKEEDFYELLGLEKDATQDEIKRAYKRQSLQMHPDKLAQKGKTVTDLDQSRFTRMKEAYEVLSDPHKRETYDAIGERGLKWLEQPFSMSPQEMAHNFANSSTVDRSKIFGIFVAIGIAIFILPVLVCLQVDNRFGPDASWIGVLTPLWIWDIAILFYHVRVITMGPLHKPDNIPDDEWIDPLPMSRRILSLFRFLLIVTFQFLLALKLDNTLRTGWATVFLPIYCHEVTTLYKKLPVARIRIVTLEDLETAMGKPFEDFTREEKELVSRKYSVVPSIASPEFEAVHRLKARARQDIIKLCFRAVFYVFFILQLDDKLNLNWWLVFLPFWVLSFCICCGSYQTFAEAQAAVAERDPEFFGENDDVMNNCEAGKDYVKMGDNENKADQSKHEPLPDEERNELKAVASQAGSKFVASFFSQTFIVIVVCLLVGKLQGAHYSAVWIISPFITAAILILGLLGCAIYCITNVVDDDDDNEKEFDTQSSSQKSHPFSIFKEQSRHESHTQQKETPLQSSGIDKINPEKSTWDPEHGEQWHGNKDSCEVEMQEIPEIVTQTSNVETDQQNQQPETGDLLGLDLLNDDEKLIQPTLSEVEDLD